MRSLSAAARAAVPYGLATVDLHAILCRYALDPSSPEFKAPLSQIGHTRGLADPRDLAVVAPNVDTPYSHAWLDLRTGPVLLTMPPHDADRYMSAMVVDLYGYIVGYVSPRTAGDGGGTFLIRGPSRAAPNVQVDGAFDCPTDLCLVLVRTQLFDDDDLHNVSALQDGIRVEPLGPPGPPLQPPPPVDVRQPLDERFLQVLDWMLRLMPRLPEDAAIRSALDGLGCGNGQLTARLQAPGAVEAARTALGEGVQDVMARCATVGSSAEIFGTREFFDGDHLSRAAGAFLGILGNSAEEYLGVGYRADSEGRPFDGRHDYRIHFAPDAFPPVGAFWSITLYDADQHLYPNAADRYVLGSRQLPRMRRDARGGVTLWLCHQPPPAEQEPNWLPTPDGPFGLAFRTYLPLDPIRDGSWTAPPVQRLT